ncbi:hypothetical protein MuYL_1449 [Mucilaginibacter xinganensis]|uniref:Uncharacterized protein n=2 Tax=Mucilaginibacter xinganensis TaxID=1234841 RepID=A0A223NU07_9SPHI|nr:hypothetical protein MuYL_1449 [Mucilaginibacter xinganensis]
MCGIKKKILLAAIFFAVGTSYCFKSAMTGPDWQLWTNKCLMQSYDSSADPKLKKFEFSVTTDAFIRLRKTYAKGKEEYYSFNLHQLNDLDYVGNTAVGTLQLRTIADDIIVQTRNDRKGDVDSMTTVLNIPVKNMEPERLDSLKEALNYFKSKGL